MTDFKENPTKIGGSISNSISPNRKSVKIRLVLKNSITALVLTLINILYLPHNLSNFVSLGFLIMNVGIFYYNKDQILYS